MKNIGNSIILSLEEFKNFENLLMIPNLNKEFFLKEIEEKLTIVRKDNTTYLVDTDSINEEEILQKLKE